MNANIRIGRIWNIPIGLSWSWFLVFILVSGSLSSGFFPAAYPQMSTLAHWLLGSLTALLFFASVLAHELGHAYQALRERIPVQGITLFIFGGVAQIEREPETPGAEFRIALAGPLVSLGLSGLFGGLWLIGRDLAFLAGPAFYLGQVNLLLAVFNMLPGFPMDGGRVLRALLWQWSGSLRRATRIAAGGGQVVGLAFVGLGFMSMFGGGGLTNGLWLAFIGWYLQSMAAGAGRQAEVEYARRSLAYSPIVIREMRYDYAPLPVRWEQAARLAHEDLPVHPQPRRIEVHSYE